MKKRAWGPFRFDSKNTRWDQKTVAVGIGKRFDQERQEWIYFIGLVLWAVYVNIGIKKGWWKR